jgi:pimeloyl-ACP methyl ester carboxylesterase
MFITPVHVPLEEKYKAFAYRACEFFANKRSEIIHQDIPRHHVMHRFIPTVHLNAKKILITHGWMSRAAYMVRLIRALQQQGYDVYALDFPAHGEAKGLQLPWVDAIKIIKNIINQHGPFYGVIGHSFGGSMILNTLNLAGQLPEFQLIHQPERVVLIAAPTFMHGPVKTIARRFNLSGKGYLQLRQLIHDQAKIDPKLIRLHHFIKQTLNIPFLCIHGELDTTIAPKESIVFCDKYQNANLFLLTDADHVSVLHDERVEGMICNFFS